MELRFNFFYNYFHLLNKSIIRKKEFHLIISIIDAVIILLKMLNIYVTDYNSNISQIYKGLSPSYYFIHSKTFIKLVPIIIYLIIVNIISIVSLLNNNNKINRIEIIIINIFEILFMRLLFIFFCEFLFYLPTLFFLLFFILSIPYLVFVFINMTYFHLDKFMINEVSFPFDSFTSICDREKTIIKIFIAIGSISTNVYICKFIYFSQYILLLGFCYYNTYILFCKSYYMMNNGFYDKSRYSNLLSLLIIQTLLFFMKNEEIFQTSFITIFICVYIFLSILIFIAYDPYNHIIIKKSENPENLYYYFFLRDRNKNISFYLDDKIKEHISKCNCCSLCYNYQKLEEKFEGNDNAIELLSENEYNNNEKDNNYIKNKNDDHIFNLLYSGKDKSMILFNRLINNIKILGHTCLINNVFYTIKFTYIYYYSLREGDISFALNMILLFNLIQENNQNLISVDKITINQIIHINEFLVVYKEILTQIKDIISKTVLKRYIDKFFTLSEKLKVLNSSKFKENLFMSKMEGASSYSYLLNICSLLYEEIFNKSISTHSLQIRENPQLIEDTLKNFVKQSNHIILNFNLKTMECKILNAGLQLIEYINQNFYDLFPNQIKMKLIQNFCHDILYPKEKSPRIQKNRNSKQISKQYIEMQLIIKNNEDNASYFWILNPKLTLLFNFCIRENIILNGYFIINKNTLMTIKTDENKEKIVGFGSKDIMNASYSKKLNYLKFLESDYMRNKSSKEAFTLKINDNELFMYTISENKLKRKKNIERSGEGFSKQFTNFKGFGRKNTKNENLEARDENFIRSRLSDNSISEEEKSNNEENIDNSKKVRNLIEDTASQSSAGTKTSLSSFWNINKPQARDNQNNFTSKKFFKLQLLLGAFLLILLVLIIILILKIKMKQNAITIDCNNYLDLIQFIRVFQQFSVQFLTIACVAYNDDGDCKSYISQYDTEEFNQTLFLIEQNEALAELGSESINDLIINSESIHDEILLNLLKGNFTYNLINKKKVKNIYQISNNLVNISLNDALLLTSNNMRIIVSAESRAKNRDKEVIYLLSGYTNPFEHLTNLTEDLSDYQIAVYTYLLNFKGFNLRFSILNQRFHSLINIRNDELLDFFYILHNIIFVVMIFQIITILFYLYTYNSVLAEIINSIIAKFDVVFDNDNDFKKLYLNKINLLESLVNEKNYHLGNSINNINKNCSKYENLVGLNKKNEQKLNMNKRFEKEEETEIVFKDSQKYINWIDIYKKGFDKFYIVFTIIIAIIDVIIYGIIFGIWKNYEKKYILTLKLIHDSWDFERYTLILINLYHHMIFTNQTLDNFSDDYFSDNSYSCVENFLSRLRSYNQLRGDKKRANEIFKSYSDFCDYTCQSLFDYMSSTQNTWATSLDTIQEKYGLSKNKYKQHFIAQCEEAQTFLVASVSPSFQGFYQKCIDAMILFNDRSYEALLGKLFNSNLAYVTSLFNNVIRYILYIIGKVSYTGSFDTINGILGNSIIISLVLYIFSECLLFVFFFFVYIWNINIECKNMFILKKVFEVTNLNDS